MAHVPRPLGLLASFAVAVALAVGCSGDDPDRVLIDEGTIPPEATATSEPTGTSLTTTAPSTSALGPPTLTESSAVTTAGIDGVEFGMSAAEVERAAGSRLVPAEGADTEGCYAAAFEEGPPGLTITISDDTFERLDVTEGAVATRSGAGIGDTAQQLRDLFGDQLVEGPDPDGEGQAMTFVPQDEGDAGTRVIFVIEDDRVASFRAGTRPMVDSGC